MEHGQRSAECFLTEIREELGAGQIAAARRVAEEAARQHPQNAEICNARAALHPSISSTKPASGRDTREEYAWLRDVPEEYRGKWVALIGRKVVGSAATLRALLSALPPDLEQIPLTVQVAS